MEPGIYLEVKPALSDVDFPGLRGGILGYKHAYLLLRRVDGSTEVIRGGPDDLDGGSIVDLAVETGRRIEDSEDDYTEDERPGSRPSRRLPIPMEKAEEAWAAMRRRAERVKAGQFGYDPLIPGIGGPERTSNSVVRSALEAAGVPLEKALPDGIGADLLPGIENDLERDFERRRRSREERGPVTDPDPGPAAEAGPAALPPAKGAETASRRVSADRFSTARAVRLFRDISRDDPDDVERILLKRPDELTEEEVRRLGRRRIDLPQGDPEAARLFAAETAFYDDAYGTGPQKKDETGRPMPPVPRRPVPTTPKPLRTPEGEPLDAAIGRLAGRVGVAAERDGAAAAVRRLQRTLNDLPDRADADDDGGRASRPVVPDSPLKEDGVFGPKTRGRLTRALALHGVRPLEDGLRGRRPAVPVTPPPMRGHGGFRPA